MELYGEGRGRTPPHLCCSKKHKEKNNLRWGHRRGADERGTGVANEKAVGDSGEACAARHLRHGLQHR